MRIITKSHSSFFLRFTILAHGNGPVRGRGSICTYSYRFFALDCQIIPQGKTSLSAAAIRADDFIPMTERDPQIFRFGTGTYHDTTAVCRICHTDSHVMITAAGVLGVNPFCRIARIFFCRIANQVPHTDDRILLPEDFCQLMVIIVIIRAEYGIMDAFHIQILAGDDTIVSSVFHSGQFVVIAKNGAVHPFRRRGNTEHDAVFRLGAVIVIVAAGSRFCRLGAVIMHFRRTGSCLYLFQLCHIDGIGILRAGCYVCNLAGHCRTGRSCRFTDRNSSGRRFPCACRIIGMITGSRVIAFNALVDSGDGIRADRYAAVFFHIRIVAEHHRIAYVRRMRFNRYIFRHLIFLFENNIARSIFHRIRFLYSLLFRSHGSKDYIVFTTVHMVIIPNHYISSTIGYIIPGTHHRHTFHIPACISISVDRIIDAGCICCTGKDISGADDLGMDSII